MNYTVRYTIQQEEQSCLWVFHGVVYDREGAIVLQSALAYGNSEQGLKRTRRQFFSGVRNGELRSGDRWRGTILP